MRSRDIEKLVKRLLLDTTNDKGVNFLLSTRLKKFIFKSREKLDKSWSIIYFKLYPRFKQIRLKYVDSKDNKLFSIIRNRESNREFLGKGLTLKEISKVIYNSCGIRNLRKIKGDFNKSLRMYPSAGARYPLEVYPVVLRSKDIPLGIYHFNVKHNSLELLLKGNFEQRFTEITGQEWVKKSALIILITAVFSRTTIKYGERGWRYILFESGHLAQNIYLISTALRLRACAIGGFLDEDVINLLDLDPERELPLYLIAIGR